jgi:NAD(P) transhydrogenase
VLERVEVIAGGGERYVRLTLSSGRTEVSDLLLVVAGRVANPPTIAEGVELATDVRGFIVVDEAFRTSLPGVYAIGDATGPPFRLGTALYQARAAVCDALSGAFSPVAELPMSVHTIPQIATVGLGEDAARMLGMRTVVGTACEEDLVVRGMSHDPIRLLKLTFDGQTGQLMGVQIAGGAAAELIHLGAQFIAQGAHAQHIASAIFSHPSQADAFRVAATAALDWSAFAREQLQGEGATP